MKRGHQISMQTELRAFYAVVGVVLLIPLVGGFVGAFGGLAGMAMDGNLEFQQNLASLPRGVAYEPLSMRLFGHRLLRNTIARGPA